MIEDMQLRNRSPVTIEAYVRYVAQFAKFFGCSPEKLTPEHVRQYQLHLLRKKVSWSTFNQSVGASYVSCMGPPSGRKEDIERLPYGEKPKRIPVVLSRDEASVAQAAHGIAVVLADAPQPGLAVPWRPPEPALVPPLRGDTLQRVKSAPA